MSAAEERALASRMAACAMECSEEEQVAGRTWRPCGTRMLRVLRASGSGLSVLGEEAGKVFVGVRRRKGSRSMEDGKRPILEHACYRML